MVKPTSELSDHKKLEYACHVTNLFVFKFSSKRKTLTFQLGGFICILQTASIKWELEKHCQLRLPVAMVLSNHNQFGASQHLRQYCSNALPSTKLKTTGYKISILLLALFVGEDLTSGSLVDSRSVTSVCEGGTEADSIYR